MEQPRRDLAEEVLPLIRTRADLWRRTTSSAHGVQMQEAVDRLEEAFGKADPGEVYAVTHKATEVDQLIADLRETHRNRPRLQREFDAAGLP